MSLRPKALVPVVQVVVSLAIVVLLVRQAELDAVVRATSASHVGWLGVALLARAIGLTLHEVRLRISLLPNHPRPLLRVVVIGWAAGLVNTVLPMRSGDVVAVALLRTELAVPTPAAISAVGVTALVEVLAFATFLLGVMVFGATRFDELLGSVATDKATLTVSLIALGGLVAAVGIVLVARRLDRAPEPASRGLGGGLRSTLRGAGDHLAQPGLVAPNAALAATQVVCMVTTFWSLLNAIGSPVEQPLLAVAAILAVGTLASVALPPSLGAGPAAVSVFVLGFFGVPEALALAYAALTWCVSVLPAAVLGSIPLWRRLGVLGAVITGSGARRGTEVQG